MILGPRETIPYCRVSLIRGSHKPGFECTYLDVCDFTIFRCDDYFVIPFRGERRGVGGIFFDDLESPNLDEAFQFLQSAGNSVLPSYAPLGEYVCQTFFGIFLLDVWVFKNYPIKIAADR